MLTVKILLKQCYPPVVGRAKGGSEGKRPLKLMEWATQLPRLKNYAPPSLDVICLCFDTLKRI